MIGQEADMNEKSYVDETYFSFWVSVDAIDHWGMMKGL